MSLILDKSIIVSLGRELGCLNIGTVSFSCVYFYEISYDVIVPLCLQIAPRTRLHKPK